MLLNVYEYFWNEQRRTSIRKLAKWRVLSRRSIQYLSQIYISYWARSRNERQNEGYVRAHLVRGTMRIRRTHLMKPRVINSSRYVVITYINPRREQSMQSIQAQVPEDVSENRRSWESKVIKGKHFISC
jgi:hypothetical protein